MTARPNRDDAVLDEALAWQAALESDDADWDGYMSWLEADPRHRAAFDSVALVAAAVDTHRDDIVGLLEAQTPTELPRRRFSRALAYAGGGMAAALALMVAVPVLWAPQSVETYSADGGKSRSVALANGIHVTLSPASRMIVRGKDAGQIELASGEAYFDVRHDPARTLTVSAGGYNISDIGTRFAVNVAGKAFRVGVADGTVSVVSPGADGGVPLAAGHQLVAGESGLIVSPVAGSDVGSWRSGDAPLPLVAADIARYSGKTVRIDPSLEKAHFSGTLVIGDGSKLLSDLAAVMDVDIQPEKDGVRISAAGLR
ncbi:MAG: FecR domain-containing protein [bacterium]|nr:FecR domain-containing protein [bacterium]